VKAPPELVPSSKQELRAKLAFLDGLRGIAAFYVMVGHARWLLWEGYADGYKRHPEHYSMLGKVLVHALAAFRWGHEAVLFFFVLSGFVIHLRYATRLVEGRATRFDFWPYIGRRARRLYPPLVAALIVTLGLDLLGAYLRLPTALHVTRYEMLNANLTFDHTPATLLRNLLFIMDPVFGSDGPLWSLNYEWYFYLIYPAIYLVAQRSWKLATLAVAALSVLGFSSIWAPAMFWLRGVFQLMISWWFGALLAERFAGRWRASYGLLSACMLAPLALRFGHWSPNAQDILVGLGVFGFIAACLGFQERGGSLRPLARLRPLGDMSYTLYVVHFPILVLMSGLLMRANAGWLPEHQAWIAGGVLISLVFAWALHLVVERPFTSR
jgi:peptidoglycan/LPS O-acetylase OafA/YrhL